jgi:hypothetical protein
MAFIESSKNRTWTLPPDIRDLIPSDHICYLIESFVDMSDFTEFEIRYNGSGHPAYHPSILCKILIQSMLDRVRPSRSIARNVRENVVYMYLAENLQPDFRTLTPTFCREYFVINLFFISFFGPFDCDYDRKWTENIYSLNSGYIKCMFFYYQVKCA